MNYSSIDQAYPNGTPVLLTLKFKNGKVLRRQSALILMQYLCDARLSSFEPEIQDCVLQTTTRPNS
jgi:hypothetical protein